MNRLLGLYLPVLLIVAGLFVLSGCVVQPVGMGGDAQATSPFAATLADANNPVEMAAAPVVSRLALYTHNAAQALRDKRISKVDAIAIRENERALRSELERAVIAGDMQAIDRANLTLNGYVAALERMK